MKRILFIPAQGFAHVTRTLRLAEAFKTDYDIQIILSQDFSFLADKLQIKFRLFDIGKIDYQQIIKGNFDSLSDEVKVAKEVALYEQAILDFQPDVIVTSAAVNATIAIKKHGITHVSITDSCNVEELKYGGNFNSEQIEMIKTEMMRSYNSVAEGFGVATANGLMDLMTGDFNVMPDLPYVFPLRERLPNFEFIGPLTWQDSNGALDARIRIDRSKPLIYVSMGSSGKTEDMETLARILQKSSYQAIMTTGGTADLEKLKQFERPGFYIEKFIAGDQIIRASDKTIVVCHAGLGTVYQAFENNTYGMITIPAHMQHDLISKRLTALGMARELRGESINTLIEVCDDIISKPQAEGYAHVREQIAFYQGPQNGKAAIEKYLVSVPSSLSS